MGAEHVVQMFLLGSVVFTFSGDLHPQQVTVELEASVSVPDREGRVVDTEKQLVGRPMPLLQTLVRRKLQHLSRMLIWILEIERRNAGRLPIPVGKPLRP